MKRTMAIGAAALATVAIAAGCTNSSNTPATSSPTTSTSAAAQAPSSHNDADVMFAQHMIPHHQQAVEMSDMLLAKQGIDKRVTDLATQIKAAQAPEIQQMQGWLTAWGNPSMPPMPSGDMGHGGMPGMSGVPMQGMMSDADMNALRDAQGVEAAKLYLTQMIAHHEGAITMAQDEIKDGQYPDAVKLAHAIVTTQQQEIDTMRAILGTL
ncbi:DUF305 domain-containing protein [Mycobacterium sp. 852013-50091_SCH5140682]|uniref:DUF305 domain-containing protein n=1 Tax=Mycobacterium sp. 852013-50091_SCH5140682 TaxID=1834109 RepID=UPI0007E9F62C|nr:DUF305 domain-containing protein [Mycobacterium sp. 852013-50091_SCH5140682]OBC12468.1 DUF305 domain-containing protein [Mycobacterium sp. 852013-50091_SCH5140682]